MAEALVTVEARTGATKSDVKKARDEGKIPAVVYGKKVPGEPVFIDEKVLASLLKTNPGGVIRMEIPNFGQQSVMINEVQRDKLTRDRILHVDFHQIDLNEKVKATVRVELTGEAKGVAEGGILQQLSMTLDIRCFAGDIPPVIEADVTNLEIGDHLYARDIRPPAGVEIKSDPNDMIATVLVPQKEEPEATREDNEETVREDAEKEAEIS
ncbi:50S ribosomal protein L25 [Paenibacillus alkalitolerans]|uniref:50S ribosomal protein L25 n=1 Tax=Paenibacillus alkalitolerans TaxID=2799335 RepID=UPI0018F4283B|nr:50S ribosomal protein L25 [Paenibacillus alkalitolerans]